MISLIVGTLLALAALAYVLYPLLSGGPPETDADARVRDVRRNPAIDPLGEVEFDRETGDKSEDRGLRTLRSQDQPPSTIDD